MRTKAELRKLIAILKNRKKEVADSIVDVEKRTIPLALLDSQIHAIQWVLETKYKVTHWVYCPSCTILHHEPACPACHSFTYRTWENKWP